MFSHTSSNTLHPVIPPGCAFYEQGCSVLLHVLTWLASNQAAGKDHFIGLSAEGRGRGGQKKKKIKS